MLDVAVQGGRVWGSAAKVRTTQGRTGERKAGRERSAQRKVWQDRTGPRR